MLLPPGNSTTVFTLLDTMGVARARTQARLLLANNLNPKGDLWATAINLCKEFAFRLLACALKKQD